MEVRKSLSNITDQNLFGGISLVIQSDNSRCMRILLHLSNDPG